MSFERRSAYEGVYCRGTDAEVCIKGIAVNNKLAVGRLKFLQRIRDGGSKGFAPHKYLGVIAEKERYQRAVGTAKSELDGVIRRAEGLVGKDKADIFNIHKLFLEDEELEEKILSHISAGKTAEESIDIALKDYEKIFGDLNDSYLSARIADLKDVFSRLKRILGGADAADPAASAERRAGIKYILVSDDLTPSEAITLDTSSLCGFATFEGSSNSHTAILARSMGIPALIGTGRIDKSYDGKMAVIDGKAGVLYISPSEELISEYKGKIKQESDRRKQLEALRGKESITRSGRKIRLYANIGGVSDARAARSGDAEGIGLLRSEFLYLGKSALPTEAEQFEAYRSIAEIMEGRPVIIRTLDIGADKKTDSITMDEEENPALGQRGIRLCLNHIDVFRTQLRAILRASAYGNVSLMLPMIVSVSEVIATKKFMSSVMRELDEEKLPYDRDIKVGIMIETPAAAVMADELAAVSDFFSVGSNDLCQYTLAADRQNKSVEYVCNDIEPVLRLMAFAAKGAHRHGIWIGVCGELAADTSLTERFIEMGIDELSVSSPYILAVREKIRNSNY